MNSSTSIVREIGGRDVLPVWALPYVMPTGRNTLVLFEDALQSMAQDSGRFVRDLLTGYQWKGRDGVSPVSRREWEKHLEIIKMKTEGLQQKESYQNENYGLWLEECAKGIPTQAFVYRDEFKEWYGKAIYTYVDDEDGAYRSEDHELVFDPMLPYSVTEQHKEWFSLLDQQRADEAFDSRFIPLLKRFRESLEVKAAAGKTGEVESLLRRSYVITIDNLIAGNDVRVGKPIVESTIPGTKRLFGGNAPGYYAFMQLNGYLNNEEEKYIEKGDSTRLEIVRIVLAEWEELKSQPEDKGKAKELGKAKEFVHGMPLPTPARLGKTYQESKLCWEQPWAEMDKEGRDSLRLEAFVTMLAWNTSAMDGGFSAFIRLLENGLPVYDQSGMAVCSAKLIENCKTAKKQDEDEQPELPESGIFLEEREIIGDEALQQYFDEDKTWEDYLSKEEQRYIIYRFDLAKVIKGMGGAKFPWISLQGKRVQLQVADFIDISKAAKAEPTDATEAGIMSEGENHFCKSTLRGLEERLKDILEGNTEEMDKPTLKAREGFYTAILEQLRYFIDGYEGGEAFVRFEWFLKQEKEECRAKDNAVGVNAYNHTLKELGDKTEEHNRYVPGSRRLYKTLEKARQIYSQAEKPDGSREVAGGKPLEDYSIERQGEGAEVGELHRLVAVRDKKPTVKLNTQDKREAILEEWLKEQEQVNPCFDRFKIAQTHEYVWKELRKRNEELFIPQDFYKDEPPSTVKTFFRIQTLCGFLLGRK